MPPTSGWATRSKSFAAKTSPDKGAEAFIVIHIASRDQKLRCHAQVFRPRKQRRLNEGPEARRRKQEKTFGQRLELAADGRRRFSDTRIVSKPGGRPGRAVHRGGAPRVFR